MERRAFAVVVTFHPGPTVAANLRALRAEGLELIVVDNGSAQSELKPIEQQELVLLRNCRNLGIAAALNTGVADARERGAEWIFTFDQDSRVQPGFVAAMIEAWQTAEQKLGDVGLVAPLYRDQASGRVLAGVTDAPDGVAVARKAMTSGNLLRPLTFDRVGSYAEDYFIDYVDVEFSLRCRRAGLAVVQSTRATLLHNLGRTTFLDLLGVSFKVSEQPAVRRYYMMRNRLRTYLSFAAWDPRWFADEVRMVVWEELKMLLFERDRLRKLRLQTKGIIDALRGRTGPL